MVVVPLPPFAPKNESVRPPGPLPVLFARIRAATDRMASWTPSTIVSGGSSASGGQGKNSLAPARMACRIKSGSATPAMVTMAIEGQCARTRSTPPSADAPVLTSTMARSGVPAPSPRSSTMLTGVPLERSTAVTAVRNWASCVLIIEASCAM